MKQLKESDANLTTAFIRTDNAGCYKGSETLLAVEQLYQMTGIFVSRVDFSDAQSGKGPCDRMASVMKGNIRRFVNEKNDCVTSSNFVEAAKSTRFVTLMTCRLSNSPSASKTRWQGVQNFNNIRYELTSSKFNQQSRKSDREIKVTVWRAFGIGSGQTFNWSNLNPRADHLVPIQIGTRHENLDWQADSSMTGGIILLSVIDENIGLF